jgi:hypothetical protein
MACYFFGETALNDIYLPAASFIFTCRYTTTFHFQIQKCSNTIKSKKIDQTGETITCTH